MIPRLLTAVFCVLGPLTCAAQGGGINGEATYVSFSVPGSVGTYPMSINASMAVTGYYYVANVSPAVVRGFLRDPDGTITTFDVGGPVWTIPESINAAGDITGFFQYAPYAPVGPPNDDWNSYNQPQGFLRYANGHTIAIQAYPQLQYYGGELFGDQPVSINDFGDIAGNSPYYTPVSVFTRSAGGVYKSGISFNKSTVATGINASGSVVGFAGGAGTTSAGFVLHPDGYAAPITVPLQSPQSCANDGTFPDGINAAGTIAGWYVSSTNNCDTANTGGFVMSPDSVFSLFQTPGKLLATPVGGFGGSLLAPHSISIDQAGDVTGSYTDTAGVQHGFVRNPYGTLTTFDPPEGSQTTATGIADGGAVTGYYQYTSGGPPAVGFIRIP